MDTVTEETNPLDACDTNPPLVATCEYVIIDPSTELETFGDGPIVRTIVSDNRSWIGRVISVGPGFYHPKSHKLIPCDTQPGTLVAYDMRSIRDILYDGKWYHVVRDEAVFFEFDEEFGKRLQMGRPKVDYEM